MNPRIVIRVNAGVILAIGAAGIRFARPRGRAPEYVSNRDVYLSVTLAVEAIIAFFMVASGVSFSLYYLLYTQRRLSVMRDRELLAYLGIIVGATLFKWLVLAIQGDYGGSWGTALRDSAFAVSSVITSTGFITADFERWETAAKITLVLLMFVGGCAGPTAGGIKVIRILTVFRTILQDIFRIIHPLLGHRRGRNLERRRPRPRPARYARLLRAPLSARR